MQFLKRGNTIQQVAELRSIKENTVWEHAVKGIASNNISIYQILTKERVLETLFYIHNSVDTLKIIKDRIPNQTITYNEIACVLACYRVRNRKSRKKSVQPTSSSLRTKTHRVLESLSTS
ncbi:helix-turn-helix domain-containing protein [Candidatus Woesearchaeota archaeon]|nr:helix-turn-helix domain-containing protein [Candidatus Woesearchaeota archaeon]